MCTQLHLADGERVRGGEVTLGVPVGLAGLHLVSGQLVTIVHLHGAVDDLGPGDGLQVPHLQHHNLEYTGIRELCHQ